jgi:hypothetical protein
MQITNNLLSIFLSEEFQRTEIKLANSQKTSLKLIMGGILFLQACLAIALYFSMTIGSSTLSQLWLGLNLLVLAALLSVYHFGLKQKRFILFRFH